MIPLTLGQVANALDSPVEPESAPVSVHRVVTDSRSVRPGDIFFALRGSRFDGHDFVSSAISGGAVACVVGCGRIPPVSLAGERPRCPFLEVDDPLAALGRLACYYRRHVVPPTTVVVAVTGSNGKTTTKRMIHHVLSGTLRGRASEKSFNNHIGVPLTLLSAESDDRYVVVELGTNAPGEIAALSKMANPNVGVITSIGEAHLQGFGSVAGVAAEKASLLEHIRPGGLAIVNIDRPEIRPYLGRAGNARLITIGRDSSGRLRITQVWGTLETTVCEIDGKYRIELPLPGLHQAVNAAAAFAVARWFGIDPEEIAARLKRYRTVDGRVLVRRVGPWVVVDDTYNANPASMRAAISTLAAHTASRRVLVMGDMQELGDASSTLHAEIVRLAAESGIEIVFAIGSAMAWAVRELGYECGANGIWAFEDLSAAADELHRIIQPGDTIWVKGSRAGRLERLIQSLETHYDPRSAVA